MKKVARSLALALLVALLCMSCGLAEVVQPTDDFWYYDGADVLSESMIASLHLRGAVAFAQKALPFYDLGVGWICPALAGLVIGLIWYAVAKKQKASAAA